LETHFCAPTALAVAGYDTSRQDMGEAMSHQHGLRQDQKMTRAIAVALLAFTGLTTAAAAESPVAIVEDVKGKVGGAELMDYLSPRAVIKLGQDAVITLSYLNSCRRETITGIGTVIVGTEESSVHLADIKAEQTPCDAAHAHATERETSEAAATIVRSINSGIGSNAPQAVLYGASPLVEVKGSGELVMERLDAAGERQTFALDGKQLKGRFFDFALMHRALTPGGVYQASFRKSRIVFRIDPLAKPGATPMAGRLLRMN
jgi:hypothetical protein